MKEVQLKEVLVSAAEELGMSPRSMWRHWNAGNIPVRVVRRNRTRVFVDDDSVRPAIEALRKIGLKGAPWRRKLPSRN